MATLPRIDNLVPNPSAEVNTTGWASGGTPVLSRSLSYKWSGDAAFITTVGSAVASTAILTPNSAVDANRVQVTAGQDYSIGARFWVNNANRRGQIQCTWVNSGGGAISTDSGTITALTLNAWTLVKLEGLTAPVGAVAAHLRLTTSPSSGNLLAGEVCPVDGVHMSPTPALPAYADGSLGLVASHYHWTGTAHLSPSYRDAITAQTGAVSRGVTRIGARLYLADASGNYLEDITSEGMDGRVMANIHNTIKMSLALSGLSYSQIEPYTSYVAPVLRLQAPGQEAVETQLGLYVCTPSRKSHRESFSSYSVEGRDLTWLLANTFFPGTWTLDVGESPVAEAAAIIGDMGLQAAFPASSLVAVQAVPFPGNRSKLEIVNALLEMAAYYTVWAENQILMSMPYRTMAEVEPSLQLYSQEGGIVTGIIEEEGTYETLANRVIVYKERPGMSPIRFQQTNEDPSSAISTVNLLDPSGNPRIITKLITDTQIQTLAEARALGNRVLEESASFTKKLRVNTLPEPGRSLHEVYDLNLYGSDGRPVADGKYWVDAWEVGFTPRSAVMTHNLKRLEPFTGPEETS